MNVKILDMFTDNRFRLFHNIDLNITRIKYVSVPHYAIYTYIIISDLIFIKIQQRDGI